MEGHREHLSDIVLVINAITSIPLKQWNDLLEIEKPYFNKFRDVTFQAMYLYALSRVPVEQRKEALTRAKPFMPTILPENAHDFTSQIQSLLLTTSASDWDKRLSAALPYFDKEDPLYYKLGIINAVLGVSDEERKDVLSRALPLVKKDKVWGCTEKYINAIAKIPADQRAAILAQVELIIGSGGIPEEDEFTRDYYIDEISSLPSAPRNALFERISPQLEAATSYSARHDIFEREMNELLRQLGYAIHIARSELEKKPIQILENVTSRFSQGAQYALFIRFQDEAGIDASGLSKEFITLLFAGIVDALHFEKYENGLYLPKLPMSSEDALTYQNLGKLMMFCLNAIKEYPIGMIFDRSVFVALTYLKPEHLDKPFESLIADQNSFQEMVDIYAKMSSRTRQKSEDMNKLKSYAAPFTSETDATTLKDSFSAFGLDYDEDFINKGITIDTIQDHLAEVQQAVRREITNKYLIPHLRDYLLPLIEIAKGMRSTPFRRVSMDDVQMMGPDRLSEKLQGQISKEMVISKLRFVNIPEHKQQWVKEWISNTDTESLKTFVFGMTGAKAIGTKGLTICSANTIFYQTCYNRLTLPFGLIDNQQECNKMLNNSLEDIKGYTIA